MSAAYRSIVLISINISKEHGYKWLGETLVLYLYWTLLALSCYSFFEFIKDTAPNKTVLPLFILGIVWFCFKLFIGQKNNIMFKELKLAEEIIERTNVNLAFIEQLISETEKTIKNARRVAQWAVGGVLTIVIFLGGQLINSISNAVISTLPKDVKALDVLHSIFFSSNNIVSGSFELISMFTLLIVGALAIVYAILQIHTFSNRRYLRLFKDIEYQLILKSKQ